MLAIISSTCGFVAANGFGSATSLPNSPLIFNRIQSTVVAQPCSRAALSPRGS